MTLLSYSLRGSELVEERSVICWVPPFPKKSFQESIDFVADNTVSKKGLALDQVLGDNLEALGISCLIRVFLYTGGPAAAR